MSSGFYLDFKVFPGRLTQRHKEHKDHKEELRRFLFDILSLNFLYFRILKEYHGKRGAYGRELCDLRVLCAFVRFK